MDAVKNYGLLGLAIICAAVGFYLGSTGQKGYDLMAFLTGAVFFCAQLVTVEPRKGVLATALLATGANGYLLYSKFGETAYSACKIDAYWDCSKINSLPESELFGVPITLLGVGFYVGLALASLGSKERTPRFDQVNGLFAIPSLIFSGWLGVVAYQAGAGCIMCITIYACNVLLLWAALKGLRENGRGLFQGIDKVFGTSSIWVITSVFALVTLVGTSSWRSKQQAEAIPVVESGGSIDIAKLQDMYARPAGNITTDGTEPRLGKSNASIIIVEFADYGCPHCALASIELKQIVNANPEVQLLFKVFPLSGQCNPVIQNPNNIESCKAAMAAECAGDQGRYYEMSEILFRNLQDRHDDNFASMAKEIQLDFDRWVTCMQEPGTFEAVLADARAGAEARVQATPSLFVTGLVDGEWVEMTKGPPGLAALIEAKLSGTVLPSP